MLIIKFSDKCYTTGKFDLNRNDLIEFSAIEKQPMKDNDCKGYLTGNANQHYRNFLCVDAEINNQVKSDVFEMFLKFNHIALTWLIITSCIQKVKSVLGINRFPSSPLFCQEPAGHFGLVGIGMEQETDGNEGKYYRACLFYGRELTVAN